MSNTGNDQTTHLTSEESERAQFASRAAGIGFWEVDLHKNAVVWDGRCQELFGLSKDHDIPYNEAIRYIHRDDIDAVNAAVEAALAGENDGCYDMRYRTIGATDGKVRWVHFSGKAYFDEQGQAVRFGGIA
jgi:PAS domain S-box-containing protein